ncbi:MAG: GTP pyrophosphokinase, partial [Betaproteobacteria bacterium]
MNLKRAIEIAKQAHSGQVDEAGKPYALHPLRVKLTVKTRAEKIVAVLHDVVEQTDWTLDQLRA